MTRPAAKGCDPAALENDRSTGDALQALRSKYDDGEAGSEDVDTEGGGQPQEPDEEAVVPCLGAEERNNVPKVPKESFAVRVLLVPKLVLDLFISGLVDQHEVEVEDRKGGDEAEGEERENNQAGRTGLSPSGMEDDGATREAVQSLGGED
eukprot:CAMPEP_0196667450 /NCGR_PEP_ID=MMETSP1086-20130531/65088_1 /TAXON_ID=77921 /ORGANISM="Cyanoptyche  gloeocystis , Strain SAG4.97" /LENGTH=150 /DNA_ID=CAMNT_0042004781 /DNA_START=447 /DNA_END=899 /DNA_ORIENTATION=-